MTRIVAAALFSIALVSSLYPHETFAQSADRVPVYVSATTGNNDPVGQLFVYELREALSASSQLRPVYDDADSMLQLRVVTLNPYEGGNNSNTVYSVVLTTHSLNDARKSTFLTEWVGTCPESSARSCATSMIANADNWMANFVDELEQAAHASGQR